jgi:hypothetical protein
MSTTKKVALTILAAFVTVVVATLLGGCAPPYRKTFDDEAAAKGWTEKQKLAAFAYADRVFWATGAGENKYVVLYRRVPTSKVREQIETVLKDYRWMLDPKHAEDRKYLDTLNLTNDMLHDEIVIKAIYERVHAYELTNDLKQVMGETSSYGPEAEFLGGYNAKAIYLSKDVATAFPFTSEQIEGAKKDGTLKVVEEATFDLSRKYDHKEPDPRHLDDRNEFIWKSSSQALKLTAYKIITQEKPDDQTDDYIEGYRIVDGKQEVGPPALKIFFPASGGGAVILIDIHHQGEPGFGTPDILERAYSLRSVQDIIRQGTIIDTMFQQRPEDNRTVPPVELFKIEIARVDKPIDVWEKSPDASGWLVPFKYVTMMGDNYNVRIKYKSVKPNEAAEHAHSEFHEIEYIEKEYTTAGNRYQASPGAVTEYYRPKKEFSGPVKAEVVYNTDTKKLDFIFPDGNEISGFITPGKNKFIEDKPYAKAYAEGGKRFWIEDGGSDIYTKRKQVSPPKNRVGEYGSTVYESEGSASTDDQPIMEPMDKKPQP